MNKAVNYIPYLNWSIMELDGRGIKYLGMNTKDNILFFDIQTGSVYKYSPHTGYFRRQARSIRQEQLVTRKKVLIETFTPEYLHKAVSNYRSYCRKHNY